MRWFVIKKIFIHCSATRPSQDWVDADVIKQWHVKDNGWADIGYHEVVLRNGVSELGRDRDGDGSSEDETGAHAYGHNKNTYAICLVGGINESGKSDANFTAAQYRYLATRIHCLLAKYNLTKDDVVGHRDVDSGKACPSFDARAFVEYL